MGVNQGGSNHNHCTQRLVILHAQTYWWILIAWQKLRNPPKCPKVGMNKPSITVYGVPVLCCVVFACCPSDGSIDTISVYGALHCTKPREYCVIINLQRSHTYACWSHCMSHLLIYFHLTECKSWSIWVYNTELLTFHNAFSHVFCNCCAVSWWCVSCSADGTTWRIFCPTLPLSSNSNYKWAEGTFVIAAKLFIYCIMCILYRVFLLYHISYCSLYVVYVLPIQLLGCHSSNKRLSCCLVITYFSAYLACKSFV